MKGHVRFHLGKWRPVIYEGSEINSKGKLADKYRWLGGYATKAEAEEELSRQLASRSEGSYVKPGKMTAAQYLEHWLSKRLAHHPRRFRNTPARYGSTSCRRSAPSA
jgi:hypothetical protein